VEDEQDWKLKLRYGKESTPFSHFTVIADGTVGDLLHDFECRPGKAFMSIKVWSTDLDEAGDMIQDIGDQIGFNVDGKIEIFTTDAVQPPRDKPYGYDINFTSYDT